MLFNSIQFLVFFPIVVFLYFVIPNKLKNYWLLIASYYFYMGWNAKYALLILFSTAVTYMSGIMLENVKRKNIDEQKKKKQKNSIVALSFILNLSILFYFKYTNFAFDTLENLLGLIHISLNIPRFDILLPVGISFYTFQALSYTMDVYRDEVYAERNFFQYALFVSFFPQLVAGPIERSKNLLKQLAVSHKFDFDRAREGLLLMLWGYFLKIVLADRIAVFVDTVYNGFPKYSGWYLIIAAMLFSIQIYCDFSGYSTIAMGAAKILGIDLMENFNAPYLNGTVAQFWRNWHISLTSWFTDYVYIPLGGNRKGKARKMLNKMIVFLISGLWHGSQMTFVVWGGLNGLYQIIGELLLPVRDKAVGLLHLNRSSIGHKLMKMTVTFVLITISFIFFRADSILTALRIVKRILFAHNPWILFDGSLYSCGLDSKDFGLMLLSIGVLLFADVCKRRGIKIRNVIAEQDYWVRWLVIVTAVSFLLTFGIWGPGYNAANFIYFQF